MAHTEDSHTRDRAETLADRQQVENYVGREHSDWRI